MPTLLTHILVKPHAQERWEEILRDMVRHTHAEEPGCLRYEYWRGQEPGRYYAFLSFGDVEAFYAHQASEYHDHYLDDFADMFSDMRLEWIDPVTDGGSGLPRTLSAVLNDDAPTKLRAQLALYPILVAQWWRDADPGS